jgi:hypothetical protein
MSCLGGIRRPTPWVCLEPFPGPPRAPTWALWGFSAAPLFDSVFLSSFHLSGPCLIFSRLPGPHLGPFPRPPWGPFLGLPRPALGPPSFDSVFLSHFIFSPSQTCLAPFWASSRVPQGLFSKFCGPLWSPYPSLHRAPSWAPMGFLWGPHYLILSFFLFTFLCYLWLPIPSGLRRTLPPTAPWGFFL